MSNIDAHMVFVNPRADRTLASHGENTHPIAKRKKGFADFLTQLPCEPKTCDMMYFDGSFPVGSYGRCLHNVNICIDHLRGKGEVAYGWALYENEHLYEAEMHCVLKYDGRYYNVTRARGSKTTFSGLFVQSEEVLAHVLLTNKHMNSYIMWK
jgi:hypothetical protein